MTKEGYETFCLYLALQRHFSSTYDFFKYQGKVSASVDAYKKRNDSFSFEKASKIIPPEERVDFFVAHFLDNPKEYIRNMSRVKLDHYVQRSKKISNIYEGDLNVLVNEGFDLKVVPGDIPKIHRLVMNESISIETLVIVDSMFPFLEKHQEVVQVPFAFPEHIIKVIKYRPFVLQRISEKRDLFRDVTKNILLNNK